MTADPHAESVPTAEASPVPTSLQRPRETDPRPVNRDEHDLLTFAIQWVPFDGGPADEISIRFGMTPRAVRGTSARGDPLSLVPDPPGHTQASARGVVEPPDCGCVAGTNAMTSELPPRVASRPDDAPSVSADR